jgi:hypothetical protein
MSRARDLPSWSFVTAIPFLAGMLLVGSSGCSKASKGSPGSSSASRTSDQTSSASASDGDLKSTAKALVKLDKPEKTFDGFTLYTAAPGTKVRLVNMHGEVVHEWSVNFDNIWPKNDRPHIKQKTFDDAGIYLRSVHLYPNGDLLVVFQANGLISTEGYGLAKLDKDSKIVWRYSQKNAHDEVDVGDDGAIYVLNHEGCKRPRKGWSLFPFQA